MPQIIDVCSGIGGFSLAGHAMGWPTVFFCEKEAYPRKVLAKNFPGIPIFEDLTKLNYDEYSQYIRPGMDVILTGGIPCQPASIAGERKGKEDPRWLWPAYFDLMRQVQPTVIISENPSGILSLDGGDIFEELCVAMEDEGYKVQSFILPAISQGAPHRRDRVWIIGYSESNRVNGLRLSGGKRSIEVGGSDCRHVTNAISAASGFLYGNGEASGQGRQTHHSMDQRTVVQQQGWEVASEGLEAGIESSADPTSEGLQGTPPSGESEDPGTDREKHKPITSRTASEDQFIGNSQRGRHPKQGRERQQIGSQPLGERQANFSLHADQFNIHWYEAATRLCRVDDGLSRGVDGYKSGELPAKSKVPKKKNINSGRVNRLKALGNSVVPQVVYRIYQAIEETYQL